MKRRKIESRIVRRAVRALSTLRILTMHFAQNFRVNMVAAIGKWQVLSYYNWTSAILSLSLSLKVIGSLDTLYIK